MGLKPLASRSTIKWPTERQLSRFGVWQVKDDRIEEYLEKGFSLGLVCRNCGRRLEWTPPELEAKFGRMPKVRIADLVPRLKCSGEGGCGSTDIAVFPHLYDGDWVYHR